MNHVIKGQFDKRIKGKLLFYEHYVKFHGTKIWEPQHDRVISKYMLYQGVLEVNCVVKGQFYKGIIGK